MRLRKEMIDYLAHRTLEVLEENELIDTEGEMEGVTETIAAVITDDLSVEDNLNAEVKEMLDNMGDELENVDYRKMFQMVKTKLARERGLIL